MRYMLGVIKYIKEERASNTQSLGPIGGNQNWAEVKNAKRVN